MWLTSTAVCFKACEAKQWLVGSELMGLRIQAAERIVLFVQYGAGEGFGRGFQVADEVRSDDLSLSLNIWDVRG
ncbi:hypothetical protein P154DRAFT_518477 [Amniculicola lignicola CBS 123094]|uniref:Uncharacterized protein n=1 Tax=Amniculicola lignicola CBS 123094 TaxID=1392246 RepID=A0A6A5WVB8_9PLEO|nr:hypothetical protein P154DRAFT_518477 [Amniculicola lignicola CBS 123094]